MPESKSSKRAGTFSDKQLAELAYDTLALMKRHWFAGLIEPPVDQHMAILLVAVYALLKRREPLHKKIAWTLIGVNDVKTGRKYIARAEKLGLIEVVRSPVDRRKELLYPTSRLEGIIVKEFQSAAPDFRALAATVQSIDFAAADHNLRGSAA
jgi:hypothetical protein